MPIVKAGISQLDQIVELSSMWNGDSTPVDPDIIEKYLTSEIVFCAIDNEELIGVAILEQNMDSSQHIARLFVHPDYREYGVGTELMEEVTRLLDETCTKSFLSVSDRNPAHDFYKRFGYKKTDEFKAPSPDHIPMIREPDLGL
ncbi:MAG: GNAT family N-acetyltransferase [Alphaproteobacteria bacterium]